MGMYIKLSGAFARLRSVCIWLIAICSQILTGCYKDADTIRIYLPVDSEGVFAIKADLEGMAVTRRAGRITIRVPDDGLSLVRDDAFIHNWHMTQVKYSDNTELPFFEVDGPANNNTIGCWPLWSTADTHYYFVGKLPQRLSVKNLSGEELKKHFLKRINK